MEFPDHIKNLCIDILDGKEVEPMLHDALVELGFKESATHFINPKHSNHLVGYLNHCGVATRILGGGGDKYVDESMEKEIQAFLSKSYNG